MPQSVLRDLPIPSCQKLCKGLEHADSLISCQTAVLSLPCSVAWQVRAGRRSSRTLFLVTKTLAFCKTWSIPACLAALHGSPVGDNGSSCCTGAIELLLGQCFNILDCICLRWMSCCLAALLPSTLWRKRICSSFLPWGCFCYQGHCRPVNPSCVLLGNCRYLVWHILRWDRPAESTWELAVYHLLCTQMLELLFLAWWHDTHLDLHSASFFSFPIPDLLWGFITFLC